MPKEAQRVDCLGLHWAATTGNVGLIKFALDHGVDVNSVANGYTPLQLACTSDLNIASVQYLIDRGAEVNSQRWSRKYSHDKSKAVAGATGSTALHIACINGCVRTVDLLLRNGAVSDVKDKYGLTAVDHAITKQNTDILRLLQISRKRSASFSAPLQAPNIAMERSRRRPSLPTVTSLPKPLPSVPEGRHVLIFNEQPEIIHQKPPHAEAPQPLSQSQLKAQLQSQPQQISQPQPQPRLRLRSHSESHSQKESQSQSHLQFQLQIQIQAQPCLHSHSPAIPISPSRISPQSPTPELSYSNSSEDSDPQTISPCHRLVRTVEYDPQDWYSHGVLHPYQEDSCYLASLERRACGTTLESICLTGQDEDQWVKDEDLIQTIRSAETTQKRSWWGGSIRQKSIDSVRPSLEFKPDFTTLPLDNSASTSGSRRRKDVLSRWLPWIFRKRKSN
ncbi:hypothetical protein F4703DRAFT_1875513 [Phycomyces blakesleeanus]